MSRRRPSAPGPFTPVVALAVVALVAIVTALGGCAGGRAERAAQRQSAPTTPATPTTTPASAPGSSPSTDTSTTTAVSSAPACAARTATLATGTITVDVDGTPRDAMVRLPDAFDPARPAPVVFDFHGSSSDMAQQAVYSKLPDRGAARGYLVVTPQGSGTPRGWALRGAGTDDAFVDALLARLRSGACLQPKFFVAGISNGSAYSALYACRHPDLVAAVGMVAATLPSLCPVDHPLPAMAFHGTADPVVPYGGGMVNAERTGTRAPGAEGAIAQWADRNGCGATPTETTIGDDVTERAWTGCRDGAAVVFFSIRGGGHTWPGAIDLASIGMTRLGSTTQSVSATDRLLDFFDQFATKAG